MVRWVTPYSAWENVLPSVYLNNYYNFVTPAALTEVYALLSANLVYYVCKTKFVRWWTDSVICLLPLASINYHCLHDSGKTMTWTVNLFQYDYETLSSHYHSPILLATHCQAIKLPRWSWVFSPTLIYMWNLYVGMWGKMLISITIIVYWLRTAANSM